MLEGQPIFIAPSGAADGYDRFVRERLAHYGVRYDAGRRPLAQGARSWPTVAGCCRAPDYVLAVPADGVSQRCSSLSG